ncbi:SGNH/GDSL hydrolase family protein [Subtercola endophyticus]|uniref:SGNH/GDSL hydrolase family protein n=1 Tax=Subtercola endophyticus TaxID=2895559 RepID=UPI001E4B7BF0|nr:SGNH/GDSL hydrolase family protein [Subtercola endophyticus]UFS59534.1 SGNH/GDSL hydrolase family protein [Subtercola endophyticus]
MTSVTQQSTARRSILRTGLHGVTTAGAWMLATTVVLSLVSVAEGFVAYRRLSRTRLTVKPSRSGIIGEGLGGHPLSFAVLGDSLAYGYGAGDPDQSVGVLLANGLSQASARPVKLRNVAVIGAESRDLDQQIDLLVDEGLEPGVALIVIGGNEVMRLHSVTDSVWYLGQAVRRLRGLGCRVVVATCPDMGTVRPFVPPLRFVAHWLSRVLATAQTIVVLRAGGRAVSLADTVGAVFRSDPRTMFAEDHLHPSSAGYARAADALLPSICAAAGFRQPTAPDDRVPHRVYRHGRTSPMLVWLAFRASQRGGTESVSLPRR